MATLDILLDRQELVRILVPTDGEPRMRWVYGFPNFREWLAVELPRLVPGRLQAADPPVEQVDDILYRWITGKEILYTRQFKDLTPMADEIWEMKTADIRIFGWMYQPRKFIAVFGDYADLYKGKIARAAMKRPNAE
ncbi:MAG TPA: hypothetical protein VNO18_09230 [Xanthobacteraceae bacterium]|nr:hypothetical protein [Xanthobacteraceae bacterium]